MHSATPQGQPISEEGLALLRRLRVEYRHRPGLYRDLLTLTVWAMSADGHKLARPTGTSRSSEMSVQEAADTLGVTPRHIRRRCQDGTLAAVKRGGTWWIAPPDLATYRARHAA